MESLAMHISSIKAVAANGYAVAASSRPERSTLWAELVVLVPITAVLTLLALLTASSIAVLDPDLASMMPG
jgi:uncharacterized protein (DUF983 family)